MLKSRWITIPTEGSTEMRKSTFEKSALKNVLYKLSLNLSHRMSGFRCSRLGSSVINGICADVGTQLDEKFIARALKFVCWGLRTDLGFGKENNAYRR